MRTLGLIVLLAGALALPVAARLHLTLVDSSPREDAVLAEPPREIVLKFNESLDPERRAVSLRGPAGPVAMGPVRSVADTLAFAANINATLAPGTYTVSWLAASPNDPTIRGRYSFSVARPK